MSVAAIETDEKLMTADEFGALPTSRRPMELFRGSIATMNVTGFRHGQLCGHADQNFTNFVDEHYLGHGSTNDPGIITEHDPNMVRGMDRIYSADDAGRTLTANEELTFLDILPGFAVPVRRFFE